jgi:protein-L-isoaspartate(D-aspartate) O-methyltransferase
MVDRQIRARGVTDSRVLDALRRVPRHRFVPPGLAPYAYSDHALSIGEGQTISQPYMVGVMTEALGLLGPERVLEVGTGSGYQCAILATLAEEVFSVERIESLALTACQLLTELHFANVRVRTGDGSTGWPEEAPFQAIIVTAGAPSTPSSLLEQLCPDGGRLVAPVGDRNLQRVKRVVRHGSEFVTETMLACRFVPLVGEEGWGGDST